MMKLRIRQKIKCPCCGIRTLETKGEYEICPVCGWEDDPVQAKDHAYPGGANELSLKDARAAWRCGKQGK
ncbi:MAG: hypothetical protein MJ202_09440 [Lentisphaeria bacterium]|nr:hypothetical protein [Lentisphaeria bacterium]